jgi:hypothetical protein
MLQRSRVGTTTDSGKRSRPAILTNYPGTMPTFGSTRARDEMVTAARRSEP